MPYASGMRLGLLGPAHDRVDALERGARFLLEEVGVDRAVYLGVDHALDAVVTRWAAELVEGDPDERAVWARAAERCARASAPEIDDFLERERRRRALAALESLADDATRLIELLDSKLVVLLFDKATLDEEDILPASLLVFGKSRQPLVKQVGSRWFLSPGSFEDFGLMTLEDGEHGIHLMQYDRYCHEIRSERLLAPRVAHLKISGSS